MFSRFPRLVLLLSVLLLTVTLPADTASASSTVVVTPSDVGISWFTADTRAPGTGTFVTGPATPPYGGGSFELVTSANEAKVQLLTDLYDGTRLSDIDGIGYSTYRDPASTGGIATVVSLNLRVDLDGNGTSDVYVVYEPYQDQGNAAVLTDEWQDWDAYAGGSAKWWINNNAGGCGQNTPCEWGDIVALFPNATIREAANCGPSSALVVPCPGSLGVNQGSFNAGIVSNADGLYVSVSGAMTTFDFEPFAVVSTKDQCKKGGWQNVRRADGSSFTNQGDCIQYVNTGN